VKGGRWRRLGLGLQTLLGARPGGFFIPYARAGHVPAAGSRAAYGAVERVLAAHEDVFRATLARVEDLAVDLAAIGGAPPPQPRWDQDWFPTLDAAVGYAMVRAARPRRLVEVGAGHSTRFYARAVADGGLATRIVALDPEPRADLDGLAIEMRRADAATAGDDVFDALGPGDVLAIDSSHILMPGTDVDRLLNRVLPGLLAGTLVHVHDIFLPDDYPADWAWRGYNEQLGVAPLLTGGAWQPLFASHYVATRRAAWLEGGVLARLPRAPAGRPASLWLRKR
jgi:hypothetical protein